MMPFLSILACDPAETTLEGAKIDVSPSVVTVATATWEAAGTAPSRVEVSGPDGPWLVTDWQEGGGGKVEVPLLGLLPSTDYTATVVSEDGASSPPVEFSTGALPNDVPGWTIEGAPSWDGYLFVATLGAANFLFILDEEARVVWYQAYDLDRDVIRVRPRRDGKGLVHALTYEGDQGPAPDIIYTDWTGAEDHRLTVDSYTHDFVELSNGGLGVIRREMRETLVDGENVRVQGNLLSEVAADGTVTDLWSTWDDFVPGRDTELDSTGYWTHANALDIDADEATYTLGLRGISTIVDIDRGTGTVSRQIGGVDSDYAFAAEFDRPFEQHQFDATADGLVIFDNRDRTFDDGSRVLELTLDDALGTATVAKSWPHVPPLWVYVLGDVDRLDDGGTLVAWTSSGTMTDFGPEGDTRWEMTLDIGQAVSYFERVSALPGVSRVR